MFKKAIENLRIQTFSAYVPGAVMPNFFANSDSTSKITIVPLNVCVVSPLHTGHILLLTILLHCLHARRAIISISCSLEDDICKELCSLRCQRNFVSLSKSFSKRLDVPLVRLFTPKRSYYLSFLSFFPNRRNLRFLQF